MGQYHTIVEEHPWPRGKDRGAARDPAIPAPGPGAPAPASPAERPAVGCIDPAAAARSGAGSGAEGCCRDMFEEPASAAAAAAEIGAAAERTAAEAAAEGIGPMAAAESAGAAAEGAEPMTAAGSGEAPAAADGAETPIIDHSAARDYNHEPHVLPLSTISRRYTMMYVV